MQGLDLKAEQEKNPHFPFDGDVHVYAKMESGKIEEWERPVHENGVPVTDQELFKALHESVPVTSTPLDWIDLTDMLQSKVKYPIKVIHNTVNEYLLDIVTREESETPNWAEQQEAMIRRIETGIAEPEDNRFLIRRARLCHFLSFMVEGSITDVFNDEYWIGKIAKWYEKAIMNDQMTLQVLSAGKIQMTLLDPVENLRVIVNKDVTKFHQLPDMKNNEHSVNPIYVAGECFIVPKYNQEPKKYTFEECKRLRKQVVYHLFACPSDQASAAVNFASTIVNVDPYKKEGVLSLKALYNKYLNTTWFQYEGELPATKYDIKEQKDWEAKQKEDAVNG